MPTSRKFNFEGNDGQVLAGRLELPDGEAAAFAIFAHCFTCSKNIKAASRISRGLAELGIGVLRFDFTGLGNSEGDFSNTNFSSNVEDLISAIEALGQAYQAPSLLVGHSLGGTAALVAASRASEIKAVATIGSPADPEHVTHLFGDKLCEIETRGAYDVDLAGRKFTIRKQLLDDVRGFGCGASLTSTGKAVLILHSPQDELVEIEQARLIYERLKHPKSFVSLDGADHLLTSEEDSEFVAELIAAWAKRYVGSPEPTQQSVVRQLDEPSTANAEAQLRAGAVQVREVKGFTQLIQTRDHSIWADEPSSVGGDHKGMNPYELLLASLGACTSMTLRMYADHKKWQLESVEVELAHQRIHAKDCQTCETEQGMISEFEKIVRVKGELTDEQVQRLAEIAEKCPVHRTLLSEKKMSTRIERQSSNCSLVRWKQGRCSRAE